MKSNVFRRKKTGKSTGKDPPIYSRDEVSVLETSQVPMRCTGFSKNWFKLNVCHSMPFNAIQQRCNVLIIHVLL